MLFEGRLLVSGLFLRERVISHTVGTDAQSEVALIRKRPGSERFELDCVPLSPLLRPSEQPGCSVQGTSEGNVRDKSGMTRSLVSIE